MGEGTIKAKTYSFQWVTSIGEGDAIDAFIPNCDEAILDSTAGIAVANLDSNGSMYPEPESLGYTRITESSFTIIEVK